MCYSRAKYGLFKGVEGAIVGAAGVAIVNIIANQLGQEGMDAECAVVTMAVGGLIWGAAACDDTGIDRFRQRYSVTQELAIIDKQEQIILEAYLAEAQSDDEDVDHAANEKKVNAALAIAEKHDQLLEKAYLQEAGRGKPLRKSQSAAVFTTKTKTEDNDPAQKLLAAHDTLAATGRESPAMKRAFNRLSMRVQAKSPKPAAEETHETHLAVPGAEHGLRKSQSAVALPTITVTDTNAEANAEAEELLVAQQAIAAKGRATPVMQRAFKRLSARVLATATPKQSMPKLEADEVLTTQEATAPEAMTPLQELAATREANNQESDTFVDKEQQLAIHNEIKLTMGEKLAAGAIGFFAMSLFQNNENTPAQAALCTLAGAAVVTGLRVQLLYKM